MTTISEHTPTTPAPLLDEILEAAELLRCGRSTIYRLIEAGEIVSVRIGRRRMVTRASLVDYVDRLAADAQAQS